MTFLSKVTDVFEITGRGCVIAPAFDESTPPEIKLKLSDAIELRKPDGSVIRTWIADLMYMDRLHGQSNVSILIPPNLSKKDVPIGTEIWAVNQ